MGVEHILLATFAVLAIIAMLSGCSLARIGGLPVQAPPPAVGALRISRRRLALGEIDLAEYERIRTVLLGRVTRLPG